MDDILKALADQQRELADLLGGRSDADWRLPSLCEGWTVADVVLHLAQTNELALASVEGTFPEVAKGLAGEDGRANTVDEGAELMVVAERDRPLSELRERWQTGVERLQSALAGADPSERVTWVAGTLSARTLATTRLTETWAHTLDIAPAFGVTLAPTDRLRHVARLAWRTVPYAFTRSGRELHGPVAFELRGVDGDAWDFVPDDPPVTVVRGDGVELCLLAAQRLTPDDTGLQAEGPDARDVLELVRTYA